MNRVKLKKIGSPNNNNYWLWRLETYTKSSSVPVPLIKISIESKPSTHPFTVNNFTFNPIVEHMVLTENNTSASQKINDGSKRRRIGESPSEMRQIPHLKSSLS